MPLLFTSPFGDLSVVYQLAYLFLSVLVCCLPACWLPSLCASLAIDRPSLERPGSRIRGGEGAEPMESQGIKMGSFPPLWVLCAVC